MPKRNGMGLEETEITSGGIWDDQWDVVMVTKYFEFAHSRKKPVSNDMCG